MIFELESSEYHFCQKIINPKGHLEVKSIIYGNNPGRVFVDSQTQPTSGLIWLGNLDGFVFIGDHANSSFNQEVKVFFHETIEQIFAERQLEVSTPSSLIKRMASISRRRKNTEECSLDNE